MVSEAQVEEGAGSWNLTSAQAGGEGYRDWCPSAGRGPLSWGRGKLLRVLVILFLIDCMEEEKVELREQSRVCRAAQEVGSPPYL